MTLRKTIAAASALALAAAGTPALAGQSSTAWGTLGNGGSNTALASAALHKTEGDNAQTETVGRQVTTMYRSISSCGNCVYNQITGNNNSINGNTISGSNSGTVTSNGNFGN